MKPPRLTLIAALDENRLLADSGGIPWRLPADTAHFRSFCRGKWLLVGRKTFGEMQGWFTDHMPLVLTSGCGWDPSPGRAVASVPQALALATAAGQEELVCIGGAQVFAAALPEAGQLILTHIHHAFPAKQEPVYFPAIDPALWQATPAGHHRQDQDHAWPFTFTKYSRRGG